MDKINEYLQSLVTTSSDELHLEPNKPPYLVSSNGVSEISGMAILGTQISQIVFPLIPNDIKLVLPNEPQVEFVFPHNLGNFNFVVKKSPAGFNVMIKPLKDSEMPVINDQSSVFQNNVIETTSPYDQIIEEIPSLADEPQSFDFESVSLTPKVDSSNIYQSPDLIIEEEPLNEVELSIPQVETASVNDPEFTTTFSDSSTYEPPGNKYDYGAELDFQSNEIEDSTPPYIPSPFNSSNQDMQNAPQIEEYHSAQVTFVNASANVSPKESMNDLFYKMAEEKASDLHMSVSAAPMIRKDGKMQDLPCNEVTLTPQRIKELLTAIMPEKNKEEFEQRHDTDFAYEIPGLARFRANIFMDRKGMGGVFRIIPSKILTAEQLGLSKAIMDLCDLSKGLVVVTGPTGSGKSTTLCAMVDSINKTREDHIITIEDPIEFTHDNQKCLVNQREVHNHTDSFKDALRAALREDPDILLVGEMRDLETISIAIETAETGHLVFGTLHTTTAASTIDRIIDQFPADRQQQIRVMLSESLKGVIAQTLLPKKGGGRVAALEVLIVTPAISNLIREGKTFQIPSAMQTGKNMGMVMLNDALFAHVKNGTVEPRDAYIKAVDKTGFEAMLTKNGFKL